jgi:hypothetical protein
MAVFRTVLICGTFFPSRSSSAGQTEGANDCDIQSKRVPRQGARVRRSHRTDARFLIKEQLLEVARKWRLMATYEERHSR